MKIYHTETQADYDALMIELEEQGIKWIVGDKPTARNYWPTYKNQTRIEVVGKELFYNKAMKPEPDTPITKYTAKQEGHTMTPEQEKIWTDIATNSSAIAQGFDALPSMDLYDNANMNGGTDMVNHPPHYNIGGIETIDIIRTMLTPEEFAGYCKGNMIKYRERAPHKGKQDEDMQKAKWYYDTLKTEETK